MAGFKAKADEISRLVPLGYFPDFTRRLISEPIFQGGWHLWFSARVEKVEKVLLETDKKAKPWELGRGQGVKEVNCEDF